MISDRDRRILADIEWRMHADDPELCERLSGLGTVSGGGSGLLHRATCTTAIVCWVLALVAALLLGMSAVSYLLFGIVIAGVTVRLWRTPGDIGTIPGGLSPRWQPPFGLPPFGPR